MLKPFSGDKILSPVEMGPQNGIFWGNGGLNLRYWFRDPQKALPLAETRRLTYFWVKMGARLSAFVKNPPHKK